MQPDMVNDLFKTFIKEKNTPESSLETDGEMSERHFLNHTVQNEPIHQANVETFTWNSDGILMVKASGSPL